MLPLQACTEFFDFITINTQLASHGLTDITNSLLLENLQQSLPCSVEVRPHTQLGVM